MSAPWPHLQCSVLYKILPKLLEGVKDGFNKLYSCNVDQFMCHKMCLIKWLKKCV